MLLQKETSRQAQSQRAFPFQHGRRRCFHPHPRIAPVKPAQPSPPPPLIFQNTNLSGHGGRKLGHHYRCRSRTTRSGFSRRPRVIDGFIDCHYRSKPAGGEPRVPARLDGRDTPPSTGLLHSAPSSPPLSPLPPSPNR